LKKFANLNGLKEDSLYKRLNNTTNPLELQIAVSKIIQNKLQSDREYEQR